MSEQSQGRSGLASSADAAWLSPVECRVPAGVVGGSAEKSAFELYRVWLGVEHRLRECASDALPSGVERKVVELLVVHQPSLPAPSEKQPLPLGSPRDVTTVIVAVREPKGTQRGARLDQHDRARPASCTVATLKRPRASRPFPRLHVGLATLRQRGRTRCSRSNPVAVLGITAGSFLDHEHDLVDDVVTVAAL